MAAGSFRFTVPLYELLAEIGRQGVYVYLQPYRQGRLGAHPCPDPAQPGAFDGLVQLERIAPKRLIAKGIKAETLLPLLDQLHRIVSSGSGVCAIRLAVCSAHQQTENNQTRQ